MKMLPHMLRIKRACSTFIDTLIFHLGIPSWIFIIIGHLPLYLGKKYDLTYYMGDIDAHARVWILLLGIPLLWNISILIARLARRFRNKNISNA